MYFKLSPNLPEEKNPNYKRNLRQEHTTNLALFPFLKILTLRNSHLGPFLFSSSNLHDRPDPELLVAVLSGASGSAQTAGPRGASPHSRGLRQGRPWVPGPSRPLGVPSRSAPSAPTTTLPVLPRPPRRRALTPSALGKDRRLGLNPSEHQLSCVKKAKYPLTG